MKKSNFKFKVLLCLSFILTVCMTVYTQYEPKQMSQTNHKEIKTEAVVDKTTSKTQNSAQVKSKRKPATVQKNTVKTMPRAIKSLSNQDERVVIGRVDKSKELHFSNRYNKKWLSLYKNNFKRMIKNDSPLGLEIKKKKSVLKVKDGIARYLEHIVVNYDNGKNLPLSFEAYIDSETGQMVQSWNQTHIEYKKPIKLQAARNKFKSR